MATYCTTDDLLIASNFPLPIGFSSAQYVQLGTDEINIAISRLYKVPVVFGTADEQTKYAATILLLKQLNQFLATGRILMAIAAPGEDSELHAYAKSLVDRSCYILEEISQSKIILEGADANTNVPEDADFASPHGMVFQLDDYSGVEAFYDIVTSPYGIVKRPVPLPAPDAEPITISEDGFPQIGG